MPAISFQRQFIDSLLRGDKQQTTRKPTDRVKVGDTAHIYIEQRRRIMDKPLRRATEIGQDMIISKVMAQKYPSPPDRVYIKPEYYAHFLGKVEIDDVYDIHPYKMTGEELEAWARADGFDAYTSMNPLDDEYHECADTWFTKQYGEGWYTQIWTVIKWDGWAERYFCPEQ